MRLDQKIAALSQQPLLQTLEPAALHVIGFSLTERSLKAGEVLFRAGELSDGGFLVISGRVRAGESQEFGEGALIGETALLTDIPRPATVLALEPTRLLVLPRSLMHKVLEAHPASAAALRAHFAGQLAVIRSGLEQLA